MKVSDVFTSLAVGELSTLSLSDADLGTIKFEHHPRFIRYINDALTMIYTKFSHKIDYVNFSMVDGQNTYALQPDLVSNVLKIISVQNLDYEFDEDRYYSINDATAKHQVRTLQYDTLYFPVVVDGQQISVEYRAKHPTIPNVDYSNVEIQIHPILETALISKVAAAAFTALGGEDALSKAQILMNDFNTTMQLAIQEDMADISVLESANKFSNSGWK